MTTPGHFTQRPGFVVAITRAQSLLIVVGNPQTLAVDPMWREWLNFVHEKGGWRGKELDWNPEEPLAADGYDAGVRNQAEAEALEMIERIRARVLHNFEPFDSDDSDDEDSQADPREYAGREAY